MKDISANIPEQVALPSVDVGIRRISQHLPPRSQHPKFNTH